MKVTVKETYTANGSYECMLVTAETELGTVILSKNSDTDYDRDLPETEEVKITEYNSIEEFANAGWDNFSKIYNIADEETRQKFYDDKAAELAQAKKDGNTKRYLCKADGNRYTLKRTGWKIDNLPGWN